MLENEKSIIIKFEIYNEQTVGDITRIIGLIRARFIPPIIENLNLEANPRASKTGAVTDAIQDSIENDPAIFPFKTKGILMASSQYEFLERNRIKLTPENLSIEGILDGGHNTLAIGLDILKKAFIHSEKSFPSGSKTWEQFKDLWEENTDLLDKYLIYLKKNPDVKELDYLVPIELIVPRDMDDMSCVVKFKNDLFDICDARNNNVQLPNSDKANQRGFFDDLKEFMEQRNSQISNRIIWKTNDGGDIKAQDLIALSWIPLSLITPVKDNSNRTIEPVAPNKLYGGKGYCLTQFEKLMSSEEVTVVNNDDSRHKLLNDEVASALQITVDLPELYDYIYEKFPQLYNASGGCYGKISAVKSLNQKRKEKVTPFLGREIETLSPEGFITPLVYGLQTLMTNTIVNGKKTIVWTRPPKEFLALNLGKIVDQYSLVINMCDYDPQKVGKASQAYQMVIAAYRNVLNGSI